jgi:hypothetical protein
MGRTGRYCATLWLALVPSGGASAAVVPPHVVFQLESEAGRTAVQLCHELWQAQGQDVAAALLPAGARADTVVCLVLDSAAFARHFAGRAPDWGVGLALWPGRVIAIDYQRAPAVRGGAREIFLHEMTHALLMQVAGQVRLPAWLHEGAAMRMSGEWRWRDTANVVLEGRLPSLERLHGPFPDAAVAADQAYRASLLAVDLLERDHGPGAVARIARAAADSGDFRAGFAAATGEDVDRFQARFDAAMNLRFGWLLALGRWPTLFVLMSVLFVIGATRRLVRARRRLRAMADED